MRLLTPQPRLLVVALAVLAVAYLTPQSIAHPPHSPGHGVNETTACTLWAADADTANATRIDTRTEETGSGLCGVAERTDVPLDSPPAAVGDWNRGDHENHPSTGAHRSAFPLNTSRSESRFISDVYARVFAVQPSTRARLSPDEQPLYVASNGTLLGTVDYRVDLPEDDTTGSRRVYWSVSDHGVAATRLSVDNRSEVNATGSRTPQLDFALRNHSGTSHTLTVEAEIVTELQKRIEVCAGSLAGGCPNWNTRFEYPTDRLTVSDSIDVVEYDLSVSGYRAVYPNGDLGLVVYKNRPWLGHSLPTGGVRGVWRFYATQDVDWETLVVASEDGRTERHSPLHPMQVNGYPIETGPSSSDPESVQLLATYGAETDPPTLPANVSLDVLAEPYTASYGIATRTDTTDHDLRDISAAGLVRGVEANVSRDSFTRIPINRSTLTLTIQNQTDETVTVQVRLRDNASGTPIDTVDREGYVVVQDRRLNTSANGTVTATFPRAVGGLSARYEPGQWWDSTPGYVGDSDVVSVHRAEVALVGIIFELAVPVGLFLLAAFIVDRATGWRLWPPWRGLS